MDAKLENFAEAFSPPVGLCRHQCECGKQYYDCYNTVDWEEGEYEKLQAEGIAVDGSIGLVEFEGSQYAWGCDCWQERARRLIAFIKSHGVGIADFLKREKERAIAEAAKMPTIPE